MTRRCSHCSHDGHNSRTCPNRGVKLFGVRLTDGSSIRKSSSMGNLSLLSGGASPAEGPEVGGAVDDGYASEDFVPGSSSSCRERKRGTPWTEDEHRMFLLGLKNLGKGDWRGISRNYVVTRTPTQVASHAQKYFIRQTNMTRRKRRSSLFDMVPDEPAKPLEPQTFPVSCQEDETQNDNPLPVPPSFDAECESMDSNNSTVAETPVAQLEARQCSYYPVIVPAYCSPFMQLSLPLWPGYGADSTEQHAHEIVKPTAIHSKIPLNVDELVGISKLSIRDHTGETASLPSVDLLGGSKRQSAFHASAPSRSQA